MSGRPAASVRGRSVAVVGLGVSGTAAARLAADRGCASLRLLDADPHALQRALDLVGPAGRRGRRPASNAEAAALLLAGIPRPLPHVATYVGEPHRPAHVRGVDVVVVSPGVPPSALARLGLGVGSRPTHRGRTNVAITSELAFAACEPHLAGVPTAAITGTNGKTTTTHFCSQILEALGARCEIAGNVGTPLASVALAARAGVRPQPDALVIEASSYQLAPAPGPSGRSFPPLLPDASAILNLTPDHLERHGSMASYAAAKAELAMNTRPNGCALVPAGSDVARGGGLLRGALAHPRPAPRAPLSTLGALPGAAVVAGPSGAPWAAVQPFPRALPLCVPLDRLVRAGHGEHTLWNAAAALFLVAGLLRAAPGARGRRLRRRATSSPRLERAVASLSLPPHRAAAVEMSHISGPRARRAPRFVDDSKATNVAAAAAGLAAAMAAPGGQRGGVVLLGGKAKRLPGAGGMGFAPIACLLSGGGGGRGRGRRGGRWRAITFGADGDAIAQEVEAALGPRGRGAVLCVCSSLAEATAAAALHARPGQTVLLSPGAASFDEFASFEDRGRHFQRYARHAASAP